jgi:hypothetical protein
LELKFKKKLAIGTGPFAWLVATSSLFKPFIYNEHAPVHYI